jgi:hypothetical protein
MGQGSRPTGSFQADYREGDWVGNEVREDLTPFRAHQRVSYSC